MYLDSFIASLKIGLGWAAGGLTNCSLSRLPLPPFLLSLTLLSRFSTGFFNESLFSPYRDEVMLGGPVPITELLYEWVALSCWLRSVPLNDTCLFRTWYCCFGLLGFLWLFLSFLWFELWGSIICLNATHCTWSSMCIHVAIVEGMRMQKYAHSECVDMYVGKYE